MQKVKKIRSLLKHVPLIIMCLLLSVKAAGQLRGTHLLSDAGLQSGTEPAPSISPVIALYNYHTSEFVTADNKKVDAPSINMFLLGLGGSVVTNVKILGGNYGASVLLALASSRVEGNLITTKSSLAFSDAYIQPVQLGWKTKRADFTAGYALYLPTGKYELGGDDNAGMGMWTNEFSGGATLYFDPKKEWTFSTLLSYGINSKKKNTGDNYIRTGNLLSIEGGLGKTWYCKVKGPIPMVINAGLVYYMQFKTTADKMDIPLLSGTSIDLGNKDRIYAAGLEGNVFIPFIRSSIGVRWLQELGAHNRTQGNAFFITLAPGIKFLHSPTGK